jgi:hypothetical protein
MEARYVIDCQLIVQGSMDEDVMDALHGKSTTQDSLLKALRVRIEKVKEGQKNDS